MPTAASVEWETPRGLFRELGRIFRFTLDVCATADNAVVERYFDEERNGLMQPWAPEVCWMNPPYGRDLVHWVGKAWLEARAGATVVALLPARTDAGWWQEFVMRPEVSVRLLRGRLKFGGSPHNAPFASAVVIFWPGGRGGRA